MAFQTKIPQTWISDTSAPGTAWATPANAAADDGVFATSTLPMGFSSCRLNGQACGFAVKPGAIVRGLVVGVKRKKGAGEDVTDLEVSLVIGGVVQATNKSAGAQWAETNAVVNFGGVADTWSASLTHAILNAADFGVSIRARCTSGAGSVASVDVVSITAYFDEADEMLTKLAP